MNVGKYAIIVINHANSINFPNTISITAKEEDARKNVFYAIRLVHHFNMIMMTMCSKCKREREISKKTNSDFKKSIYVGIHMNAKKCVLHRVYVLLVINKRNNVGRKAINRPHTYT